MSAGALEAPATTKPSGRRADATTPYLEGWAKRYWRSQAKVERDRLRKGKAAHRAHRKPLPVVKPVAE